MKIAFIFVGGHKEDWLVSLSEAYEKKLKYFCPTEIVRVRPSKQERAERRQKLAEESGVLMRQIKQDDLVILCDEKGESLSSTKMSAKFVKLIERGRPRIVIIIGGAFGVSEELRERADWLWSLSNLTLNHHIAQAVVLEQTYRAFAIWKNLPYHNN